MVFNNGLKKLFCFATLLLMFILAGTGVLANESFADASGPYSPDSSYNEGGNDVKTGDVTYVAVWEPVKTVTPRPPVITYTVIYTDGVEDEDVFSDQIHSNLYYGETTPVFADGVPQREGYIFGGWDITISDTVTGNAVYTATWIPKETVDIEEEEPPLSEHPELSDEETALVTVPELEPPLADVPELNRSADEIDIPQTGDSSMLHLYLAGLLLAGSGLAAISVCQKRKRRG